MLFPTKMKRLHIKWAIIICMAVIAICIIVGRYAFLQKQEKSFDLFPDFAESAIAYIVTDQTGELTLYTGLYNVSGKYSFLEGTINTFYNVYGGYETNELFIARMSSEDYKSMDLEMRQTSFDNTIESIYCGTPICTIIGVGQFETENNIVSGKQLYKLDIFEKASVLSTNDKPVFAMTSGANLFISIKDGWKNQQPAIGGMHSISGMNLTW